MRADPNHGNYTLNLKNSTMPVEISETHSTAYYAIRFLDIEVDGIVPKSRVILDTRKMQAVILTSKQAGLLRGKK